jgi:hypothetical protein
MGGLDALLALGERALNALPTTTPIWIVTATFLIAGTVKVVAPLDSASAVRSLGVNPAMSDIVLGRLIGVAELAVGLLSAVSVAVAEVRLIPVIAFTAMLIVVARGLLKKVDTRCACFGGSSRLSWLTFTIYSTDDVYDLVSMESHASSEPFA